MQRVVFAIVSAVVWAGATAATGMYFTQQQSAALDDAARAQAKAAATVAGAQFASAQQASADLSEWVATHELSRLLSEQAKPGAAMKGKRAAAAAAVAAPAPVGFEQLSERWKSELGHADFALVDASGKRLAGEWLGAETALQNHPAVRHVLFGLEHRQTLADTAQEEIGVPVVGADGRAIGGWFVRQKLSGACAALGAKSAVTITLKKSVVCGSRILSTGFVPEAAPLIPMFFDEAKAGNWTESVQQGDVTIFASANNHATVAALALAQQQVLTVVGGLFLVVLILLMLGWTIAQRPATVLSDQVSLAVQNNGVVDDGVFSEPFKRLAKNILQLQHRTGVKGNIDSTNVSQLLGGSTEKKSEEKVKAPTDRVSFVDDESKTSTKAKEPEVKAPAATPPTPPKFGDFDDADALSELDRVDAPPSEPVKALQTSDADTGSDDAIDRLTKSRSLSEESLFGNHAAQTPVAAPPPPPPAAEEDDKPLNSLFSDGADEPGSDGTGNTPEPAPAGSSDAALQMLTGAPPSEPVRAAGSSPWETPQATEKSESEDPDEAHFHEVYENFVRARNECGEVGDLPYPKFVEKLKKSREQVMQKQACKSVRFQVYVKDGKAALKAVAFR
jgi:hypothetical protein